MTGTIIKGEEHFFPVAYSGNGQGQRVGKFIPFTDNGTIAKSCMFNDGDSPYLTRTPSSNGNAKKFTFSCWFKPCVLGASKDLFGNSANGNAASIFYIMHYSDSTIYVQGNDSGSNLDLSIRTSSTFEDTSKWYHIVVRIDTTQSTDSDRSKIYIDGTEQPLQTTNYPALNAEFGTSQDSRPMVIGRYNYNNTRYLDGYLAEVNFTDGQSYGPDTFGITDTSTGRWIPKSLSGITYGTNGFRLQFGTDSALGDDTSGNGNDFTSSGLAASDQRTNTPTNNIAIMRPYNPSYSQVLYEGNLTTYTNGTNKGYPMCSTLRPKGSGKYYAEVRTSGNGGGGTLAFGCYTYEDLPDVSASGNVYTGHSGSNGCGSGFWYVHGGTKQLRYGTASSYVLTSNPTVTINAGDVIGIALDLDNDEISFYDDSGSLIGTTFFDSSKSACFTALSNMSITFIWNFGDNGTFSGYETAGGNTDENGDGNFFNSVPSGFKMLKQDNLPETSKGIPDFCWIKNRDASDGHQLYDSSRGVLKELHSDSNAVESTTNDGLQKFIKGGCEIEDDVSINTTGEAYVSWNWVANGGTTAANTDGSGASIASTTQANQTAGFSIVQWTGSGSNGTVAHGLSQAPDWILIKNLTASGQSWHVYLNIAAMGNNRALFLDTNASYSSSSEFFNDTNPTNKVFSVGTSGGVNQSTKSMLAYCWHEVEGYSKFGAYIGNQNADGPFIYTGFKPSWVMIKRYSASGEWFILDRARNPTNTGTKEYLDADTTDAGGSLDAGAIDWLSNGFKLRQNSSQINNGTHAFMAFGEHPFNGDGANAFATAL